MDDKAKTHPLLKPYKALSEKVLCASVSTEHLSRQLILANPH